MSLARETMNEVRWELQLSRETGERQLEQQNDLRVFLRDQVTRIDRIGRPQVRVLERVRSR